MTMRFPRGRQALATTLLAAALGGLAPAVVHAQAAQATAPVSAAKKELVAKLLQLQRPAIEGLARSIAEQPAAQMLQQAAMVVQTRVPAERREAVAKEIQAEAQKYAADAVPPLREQAVKLAPSTIGAVLEQRFSEDELKQLIAWLESPVNRKFQQVAPDLDRSLREKLVADARPTVEPKLQALQGAVRRVLDGAVAGAAPASAPR